MVKNEMSIKRELLAQGMLIASRYQTPGRHVADKSVFCHIHKDDHATIICGNSKILLFIIEYIIK